MPVSISNTGTLRSFSRREVVLSVSITVLFFAICMIFVSKQVYVLWLVPAALLILLLAVKSVDNFLLLLLFLTPLSLQLRFIVPTAGMDIHLPTELMLFLLLIIVLFKLIVTKEFSSAFLKHYLSITICVSILWMLITSFTGTNILVSLKYTLVRLWFIATFYFLAYELFRKPLFMKRAFLALVYGMVPVILYHIIGLAGAGLFNKQAAHRTVWPFFNDHTSFGAAIAILLPIVILHTVTEKARFKKIIHFIICILFIVGLIFSYSRAAWISFIIAALFALIYLLKIPWKLVGSLALISAFLLIISWSSLLMTLESNSQDSSGNMLEHVRSVSNITSDNSNLERLVRWKAALRMTREKPLVGWGPGTYQFEYAPYQFSHERTIISTNFGDGGNAHSEYLGAMADSGIIAGVLYILILLFAFRSGHKVWISHPDRNQRLLSLALMAGLMTYVIHGALNSFLDTDKISAPFWMFISALVFLNSQLSFKKPAIS